MQHLDGIYDHVLAEGGWSSPAIKGDYVASFDGHERAIVINNSDDLRRELVNYVRDNYSVINSHPNSGVGIWVEDGRFVFDVSRGFDSREECERFARENNQRAYYDVIAGSEIFVAVTV